ncbi:MAG: hydroxyethylthiazole kinase [Bacteroidales bacterium]|jgi:hydroxyethylthiazole kinase|nr:hydroxyethylthiazole kinase [Bacteroidales bacterium]
MDLKNVIENLREKKPLVHHITNYVTVNDCANITLAIGASPVMADEPEDAVDISSISSAVVLNMGTLNSRTIQAMLASGKTANEKGIPVVFDPVGVGASGLRNKTAEKLLNEVTFSVVRGNISEIRYLAGLQSETKGVDASENDILSSNDTEIIVANLAKRLHCVVAVTGKIDVISDGKRVVTIQNGVEMLGNLTGTGCMCTSLIGSFIGANPENAFESTVGAILSMGIAGEIAFEKNGHLGNGSFRAALHDAMSKIDGKIVEQRAKINEKHN